MSNIVQLSEEFHPEPSNHMAEQAVLGAIMVNNAAFAEISIILRYEHFHDHTHASIFGLMHKLINEGGKADPITLREAAPGLISEDGVDYLSNLAMAAASIVDAPTYATLVRDACHARWLVATCREARERVIGADAPSETIGWLKSELGKIEVDAINDTTRCLGDVMGDLGRQIARRVVPFSTGLPSLDTSLDGGLRVGDLYVIEAPAKTFKTGTLGTIAMEMIKNDVPSLFVTLEMAPEQIMARLVAAETGCNATNLMDAERHDDALGRVKIFTDRYGRRKAYFADRPGLTKDGLAALCSSAVAKFGVDVIFIDYWQRIGGKAKSESMADHLEQVAYWAADFARKNNVAVIMASQLNRQGESLRSAGIERACSWLARLHKVEQDDKFIGEVQALWIEVPYTRFSQDWNIGSDTNPAFRIDGVGPVLKEIGDWARG